MGNWKQSFDLIQSYLTQSGILLDCEQIVYCVNGDYDEAANHIGGDNLLWISRDISKYEFPTINYLLGEADDHDILYIHTKGASTPVSGPISDWIKVMCHFNINEYRLCLDKLATFDAVGVDFRETPFPHFSGNFWWAKSKHISDLNSLVDEDRHAAERWVCSKTGKYHSLHNTNINVYERHLHCYPPEKYL